jgi:hypothetical protein
MHQASRLDLLACLHYPQLEAQLGNVYRQLGFALTQEALCAHVRAWTSGLELWTYSLPMKIWARRTKSWNRDQFGNLFRAQRPRGIIRSAVT